MLLPQRALSTHQRTGVLTNTDRSTKLTTNAACSSEMSWAANMYWVNQVPMPPPQPPLIDVEQDTTLALGEGSTILSAVRRIVATLQRDSAALTASNNEL